jgi:hypothetical protein
LTTDSDDRPSVSVDELLAVLGSPNPVGEVTVALLTSDPDAEDDTVAATV